MGDFNNPVGLRWCQMETRRGGVVPPAKVPRSTPGRPKAAPVVSRVADEDRQSAPAASAKRMKRSANGGRDERLGSEAKAGAVFLLEKVEDVLESAASARRERRFGDAADLFEQARTKFPDIAAGYVGGAAALREVGRMAEADNLLATAAERFPGDAGVFIEWAWLAHHRGEVVPALTRWEEVRRLLPRHHAGFTGAAITLRGASRFDDAEVILGEAMAVLPEAAEPVVEHAWLAHIRRDWPEATRRWEIVRARFPDMPAGYTSGAVALREVGQSDEAERLLRAAEGRFPQELNVIVEQAWLAQHRRDWGDAVRRWEAVRNRASDHAVGYLGGALALREAGKLTEAEQLIDAGRARFPNDIGLLVEHAGIAMRQSEWGLAADRWRLVRERVPDSPAGYTGGAHALREQGEFTEAESLLEQAMARLPNDPAPVVDHAWVSNIARDWSEAANRWERIRQRFPEMMVGYTAGAMALRELGRFDDAEELLKEAVKRFPNERHPLIDLAWLATAQRDWRGAVLRWADVRARFPETREGYLRGAQALASLWQYDEADALYAEGMSRFPDDSEFANEAAWLAYGRKLIDEAERRFDAVRRRFPDDPVGHLGAALLLRDRFKLREAEAVLEDAGKRLPGARRLVLEHARLPMFPPLKRDRDPDEAFRRLGQVRLRFPDYEEAYLTEVRFARQEGRLAEAETVAAAGLRALPQSSALATEYGAIAAERGDGTEAVARFAAARDRFPHDAGGVLGLASALCATGRYDEADTMLRDALARFPTTPAVFVEYGRIAARREDWPEALARWLEGQRRFADEREFDHRIFEARLHLTESDEPAAASAGVIRTEASAEAQDIPPRDLLMQFESLGGGGHGCEFGIFQRHFGAEPLGLLRWADIFQDELIAALDTEFAGVGEPEFTEIFVPPRSDPAEYWTRDKRYHMVMRSFVRVDEMPLDRMTQQVARRLKFLREKLLSDLRVSEKIFVYKNMKRNLTDEELDRLYTACRRYGENSLFYIRYEDAEHPNGTVRLLKPGLAIGYIDHFSHTADTDELIEPATDSLLALCRHAHAVLGGNQRMQQ